MIPKIGSALSRFLEPLRPVKKAMAAEKSSDGSEGGSGNLPAEKWKDDSDESPRDGAPGPESEFLPPAVASPVHPGLRRETPAINDDVPAELQPPKFLEAGLTQVIVDIHAHRKDIPSGEAIHSYESGSREQKTGTRLPKGSMLDKKVG